MLRDSCAAWKALYRNYYLYFRCAIFILYKGRYLYFYCATFALYGRRCVETTVYTFVARLLRCVEAINYIFVARFLRYVEGFAWKPLSIFSLRDSCATFVLRGGRLNKPSSLSLGISMSSHDISMITL